MNAVEIVTKLGYILTIGILIFGFFLFFHDTHEWIGSLTAAVISAGLVFFSFIAIRWLVQVFTK